MKTLKRLAAAAALVLMTVPSATAGDDAVTRAQEALKQAGHDPGPIDGVVGARTTAALRAYQQAQGLRPTGQLDDETRATLGGGSKKATGRTPTGGDTQPSAVDPAEASRTGANSGEGASYSRSSEKGLSSEPSASPKK
jgi:peptidoglycan hydrolase-like protein with peptidoglycan-binding domain